MSKLLLKKRFTKCFCMLLICFSLLSCENSISLPNGYRLKASNHNTVMLLSPNGTMPFQRKISAFAVHGGYVYGYLPGEPYQYFSINTSTSEAKVFNNGSEFNNFLEKNKLPPFYYSYQSMTFWDIKEGHKKPNW